ncbi:MAG: hypothetical protein A4S09_10710 [Proteobacteria bacterium SG_bin7]|nr:MAG: hypothetical protein A4S09_10710 [Proteobacteria bacterium SG_bin7]
MKIDIYKYTNYKDFLRDKIASEAPSIKGLRFKIAEFVQCQPSYLSQVINGKPNFTLEQTHLANQFFHHDKDQSKYFILLVEMARAGTRDLREFFSEEIKAMQHARFSLKKRIATLEEIPEGDQHKYYSAWFYSAIHVILSIKEFQSSAKIAQHFNLPLELVIDAINFLESIGLIENKNGVLELTKRQIYLQEKSIFIQRHHINWRSQALQSVEKNLKENFHFSNVLAISKADFLKIRDILTTALEEANKIIGPSKEEAIYAMNLDFFSL